MDDILANITIDQKRGIIKITIIQNKFKFGCVRCADLCCKLGGPELTEKDIERIEKAGYDTKDFLNPKGQYKIKLENITGALKTKQDGTCIFLKYDNKKNCYKCNIYEYRPTLCKLYPFRIESLEDNQIAFKFIPCCKGLNNPAGKFLDRNFYIEKLKEAIKIFKIEAKNKKEK